MNASASKKMSVLIHAGGGSTIDVSPVFCRLDDMGLPQYKEAFLDNKVDGRVLNVLTVEVRFNKF